MLNWVRKMYSPEGDSGPDDVGELFDPTINDADDPIDEKTEEALQAIDDHLADEGDPKVEQPVQETKEEEQTSEEPETKEETPEGGEPVSTEGVQKETDVNEEVKRLRELLDKSGQVVLPDELKKGQQEVQQVQEQVQQEPVQQEQQVQQQQEQVPELDFLGSDDAFQQVVGNRQVMNRLMNNVMNVTAQTVLRQAQSIIEHTVNSKLVKSFAVQELWSENEDLKPYRNSVLSTVSAIEQNNPGMPFETILNHAVKVVRTNLGLTGQQQQPVRHPSRNKPGRTTRGGTVRQQIPTPINDFQQEISDTMGANRLPYD